MPGVLGLLWWSWVGYAWLTSVGDPDEGSVRLVLSGGHGGGQRLAELAPGQARNELARDAYSYFHLPMVAAIVLVALGMQSTLAHVNDPLRWETATGLIGGTGLYLLAHVAFKPRASAWSAFRA